MLQMVRIARLVNVERGTFHAPPTTHRISAADAWPSLDGESRSAYPVVVGGVSDTDWFRVLVHVVSVAGGL
ncbi:MAG: hypothetical protein WAS05_09855, partial [Candidatus Nanopelagicales bacterium]